MFEASVNVLVSDEFLALVQSVVDSFGCTPVEALIWRLYFRVSMCSWLPHLRFSYCIFLLMMLLTFFTASLRL